MGVTFVTEDGKSTGERDEHAFARLMDPDAQMKIEWQVTGIY